MDSQQRVGVTEVPRDDSERFGTADIAQRHDGVASQESGMALGNVEVGKGIEKR